jgi:hypothetical protein
MQSFRFLSCIALACLFLAKDACAAVDSDSHGLGIVIGNPQFVSVLGEIPVSKTVRAQASFMTVGVLSIVGARATLALDQVDNRYVFMGASSRLYGKTAIVFFPWMGLGIRKTDRSGDRDSAVFVELGAQYNDEKFYPSFSLGYVFLFQ